MERKGQDPIRKKILDQLRRAGISGSIFLQKYVIAGSHRTAADNPGEQSLPGHDAVACLSLHGTSPVMTFLADLGDLQHNFFPKGQTIADLQACKIDIPGDDILGKGAVTQAGQLFFHQIDAFTGQQRNLPVPFAGVSIIADTPVLFQKDLWHRLLHHALFRTYTNGFHMSHMHSLLPRELIDIDPAVGWYGLLGVDDDKTVRSGNRGQHM